MGKDSPNQLRTLVSRKVRYLNTPSRLRLNTTISATTPLAARLFSRTRSTHRPNSQLTTMEAIITNTNFGSPQA